MRLQGVAYTGGYDAAGLPHGNGKMTFKDGDTYEGEYMNRLKPKDELYPTCCRRHEKGQACQVPAGQLAGGVGIDTYIFYRWGLVRVPPVP